MESPMNRSADHNIVNFPFSFEVIARLVSEGKTVSLFQFALEHIRAYDDFPGEDWTPEEREAVRQDVIEAFKHQIGEAIKAKHTHCGQPVTVRGVYDFESQRHSLLIRCDCCGKATTIEENVDHVH